VSAGQPAHGSWAKVVGVALKFDGREEIGEHRGEQPYVDSDRAQRTLAADLSCDCGSERQLTARSALAALMADRALASESAMPYMPRPCRVTDQYQPRRGPRHHNLVRRCRMRSIIGELRAALQAARSGAVSGLRRAGTLRCVVLCTGTDDLRSVPSLADMVAGTPIGDPLSLRADPALTRRDCQFCHAGPAVSPYGA
jgi:hypothetical protein